MNKMWFKAAGVRAIKTVAQTAVATIGTAACLGGIAIDGIFGANTKAAVEAYQRQYKLDVDGVVGPKTWDKLLTA